MKIKITHCSSYDPAYEKMVDGSIHEVARIDQNEKQGLLGFYVESDGEEVLIWTSECTIVEEEGGAE